MARGRGQKGGSDITAAGTRALSCCPKSQLHSVACRSPLWASVFCIYRMRTTTLPSTELEMWRCTESALQIRVKEAADVPRWARYHVERTLTKSLSHLLLLTPSLLSTTSASENEK